MTDSSSSRPSLPTRGFYVFIILGTGSEWYHIRPFHFSPFCVMHFKFWNVFFWNMFIIIYAEDVVVALPMDNVLVG